MPKQHLAVSDVYRLFPELGQVSDKELADKAAQIWVEAFEKSSWDNILDAQFATRAPGVSLVAHTSGIVRCCISVAKQIQADHGYDLDLDTVIVAAILHDVCKLEEMEMGEGGPGTSVKTREGKLYQHGFLSGYYCHKYELPAEICAMCVAHSGQSKVIIRTPEYMILLYADLMNADIHFAKAGVMLCLDVE